MVPQRVENACVRHRNPKTAGFLFQHLKSCREIASAVEAAAGDLGLQALQFAMQPGDPGARGPAVGGRQETHERVEDGNYRNEDEQPHQQRRYPVWQVVLQERPSRLVELRRFTAQWKVDRFRGRKLTGLLKDA